MAGGYFASLFIYSKDLFQKNNKGDYENVTLLLGLSHTGFSRGLAKVSELLRIKIFAVMLGNDL